VVVKKPVFLCLALVEEVAEKINPFSSMRMKSKDPIFQTEDFEYWDLYLIYFVARASRPAGKYTVLCISKVV